MTRREKWQFAWFVIACCSVTVAINWAVAQTISRDPQPRLPMRGDYEVFEFSNGAQWYIKRGSIHAIFGAPRDQHEKLGFKTKVYGSGFQITLPYEVIEVVDELYRGDIEHLQSIREELQKYKDNE